MPSFDVELKVDAVELKNAVDQAQKEIGTRYDYRGTAAAVEQKDLELTLIAESDFQLRQVRDVLIGKLAGGDKLKQTIVVKSGIDKDLGKKIQTTVKNAKALKLSASLQGDVVRVSGAKRDALQECIALLRKEIEEAPLSFGNFRN